MKKLNISGGEPFLQEDFLGEIIKFSKVDLGLESTGIICNGSKVTEKWLDKYGQYLDIMGVSCDSFDVETNLKIGRSQNGKGVHTKKVFQVADWCKDRGIMFKLNSVIGQHNWEEDMNHGIDEIAPFRWKVRPLRSIIRRITNCSQCHFRYSRCSYSMVKTLDQRQSAMRESWSSQRNSSKLS